MAMRSMDEDTLSWTWQGTDEFSGLGDRQDLPPLPLPPAQRDLRVVLARHGQSTWNARNRIQGSSDFSVLTPTGVQQAEAARERLSNWEFDFLFQSPLKRAAETAAIMWGARSGPTTVLPSLREVDLYSFQGLEKGECRTAHPGQYGAWHKDPAALSMDGHAPIRELWYRASLAWRSILESASPAGGTALVVAHNAINQALLCTAVGLPPSSFRRFHQNNGALTVLDFVRGGDGAAGEDTRVLVDRVNQFQDSPMRPEKVARARGPRPHRLIMVSGDAADAAVQSSIQLLSGNGVVAPPLIGVGTPEQQALDICTALNAALSTAGDGRNVLVVASPAACQLLLGYICAEQQGQSSSLGGLFAMTPGGITLVTYVPGSTDISRSGMVVCVNYQQDPQQASQLQQARPRAAQPLQDA